MRKNSQSRARAELLRKKVEDIKAKPSEAKTQEEEELYQTVEQRRARKNNRSKERALEKKAEADKALLKAQDREAKMAEASKALKSELAGAKLSN